ncbi:MAG: response regulator transcription factor [Bacillota bacterium]
MEKIRLLITGGDSSSRRGLNTIFASESMFMVLGCCSVEESLVKATSYQPDVIILDIKDDFLGTMDCMVELKNECPHSLVIAIIEIDKINILEKLLEKGIDGCVPKNIMRGCLIKTVELACLTGIFCLPGSMKKLITMTQTEKASCVSSHNQTSQGEPLTNREMEILHLMAQNFSNRDISKKLFISEPTVKSHVSSILRKLGQRNRAQAIVFSYNTGLVKKLNP